jgi:hypothetical protein
MRVGNNGYLMARDGRHVFLVKYGGWHGHLCNGLSLPKEYIGKRVMLKLEEVVSND